MRDFFALGARSGGPVRTIGGLSFTSIGSRIAPINVTTSTGTISDVERQPNGDVTFTLSDAGAANGDYTFTVAEQAAGAKWLYAPTLVESPADTFTQQDDGVFIYSGAEPVVTQEWQRDGSTVIATTDAYTLVAADDFRQVDYVASLFTSAGQNVETRVEAQAELVYTPQVVLTEGDVSLDTTGQANTDRLIMMVWMRLPAVSGTRLAAWNSGAGGQIALNGGRVNPAGWVAVGGGPNSSNILPDSTDGIAADGDWLFLAHHGKPNGRQQVYVSINGGPIVEGTEAFNADSSEQWVFAGDSLHIYAKPAGANPLNAEIARCVLAIPDATFDIEGAGVIDNLRESGTGLPKAPTLNAGYWDTLLIDDRDTAAQRALGKHFGTLGDLTVPAATDHTQVSP